MKEEYNTTSVLHLSIAIINLELEEIEEKKAKKKKEREDKKKKEQDWIDKKERLQKEELIKQVEIDRLKKSCRRCKKA